MNLILKRGFSIYEEFLVSIEESNTLGVEIAREIRKLHEMKYQSISELERLETKLCQEIAFPISIIMHGRLLSSIVCSPNGQHFILYVFQYMNACMYFNI